MTCLYRSSKPKPTRSAHSPDLRQMLLGTSWSSCLSLADRYSHGHTCVRTRPNVSRIWKLHRGRTVQGFDLEVKCHPVRLCFLNDIYVSLWAMRGLACILSHAHNLPEHLEKITRAGFELRVHRVTQNLLRENLYSRICPLMSEVLNSASLMYWQVVLWLS